tara:strand:+ start:501 stop:719 length:219 start_codon:yes stop_codon:yes gene_type:complete
MFKATNPGNYPLKAHTKACMRNAAVSPEVEIPFECLLGESMSANTLKKHVVVVESRTTSNDFSIAFWREYVY